MNKTIQTMQKAAIAISILVLCSFLSFNSSAQDGNRTEDFINAYFKYIKQNKRKSTDWLYPNTLVKSHSHLLTEKYLSDNRQPFMGTYSRYSPTEAISIPEYLSQEDLIYIQQQADKIKSIEIDRKRLAKRLKVVKTQEPIKSMKSEFIKKESLFHFSQPLFSKDSTIAIVIRNVYYSGGDEGKILLFHKNENQWEVLAFRETFISICSPVLVLSKKQKRKLKKKPRKCQK